MDHEPHGKAELTGSCAHNTVQLTSRSQPSALNFLQDMEQGFRRN